MKELVYITLVSISGVPKSPRCGEFWRLLCSACPHRTSVAVPKNLRIRSYARTIDRSIIDRCLLAFLLLLPYFVLREFRGLTPVPLRAPSPKFPRNGMETHAAAAPRNNRHAAAQRGQHTHTTATQIIGHPNNPNNRQVGSGHCCTSAELHSRPHLSLTVSQSTTTLLPCLVQSYSIV